MQNNIRNMIMVAELMDVIVIKTKIEEEIDNEQKRRHTEVEIGTWNLPGTNRETN